MDSEADPPLSNGHLPHSAATETARVGVIETLENQENLVEQAEVVSQVDTGSNPEAPVPGRRGDSRRSRKSSGGRRGSGREGADHDVRTGAGSRARPIKPYEPNPFLSIDNLPGQKSELKTEDSMTSLKSSSAAFQSRVSTPKAPVNTPLYNQSLRSIQTSNCSSDWNAPTMKARKYAHAAKTAPGVNVRVKAPFKHAVSKGNTKQQEMADSSCPAPDQELKHRTAVATYHVAKTLTQPEPQPSNKTAGRLVKGRLKPLCPVNVTGPGIEQCRGINPQPKNYVPSHSRTVQRRKQIMNAIPPDYLYSRPDTQESIHRTSIASDTIEMKQQEATPPARQSSAVAAQPDVDQLLGGAMPDGLSSPLIVSHQRPSPDSPAAAVLMTGHSRERPASTQPRTSLCSEGESIAWPAGTEDSRKFVRFAETTSHEEFQPRSKSAGALGTLSVQPGVQQVPESILVDVSDTKDDAKTPNKTSKVQKHSCQDEVISIPGWRNDDDDDNDDDSLGGHKYKSYGPSSLVPLNPNDQPSTGTNDSKNNGSRNKKNSGSSHGKQTNNVTFGDNIQRKNAAVPTRPRSRLGYWEDAYHPDPDFENVATMVTGRKSPVKDSCSPSSTQRLNRRFRPASAKAKLESSLYVPSGANRAFGIKPRPSSAGPKEFKEAQQKKLQRRPRPPSAPQQTGGTANLQVGNSCSRDVKPATLQPQSNRPQSGRPASGRPTSGKSQMKGKLRKSTTNRSTDPGYSRYESTRDRDWTLHGNKMNQLERCDSGLDMNKEESIDSGEGSEDEILVAPGEVYQSVSGQEDAGLVTDAEELERMLLDAQQEARQCADQLQESQIQQSDEDSQISDEVKNIIPESEENLTSQQEDDVNKTDTAEETEEPASCEKEISVNDKHQALKENVEQEGLSPGGFSTTVTSEITEGKHAYQMVVYHFSEEKMCTSSKNRSRPSSGVRRARSSSATQASNLNGNVPQTDKEEKPCTGDVTSYSVTMMSDSVQDRPIEDEEEFLEMVTQQFKRPEEKNPEPVPEKEKEESGDLQVIAQSKQLQKPRYGFEDEDRQPLAPYPPVCFRVNARPPAGYIYYFAYGTDMNPYRVGSYIGREVVDRQWGLLFGFKLLFNKRGEDEEAGGFPNLEFNPYSSVEGCLYLLTPSELQSLDTCIGYPEHYEHVMLPVWLLNCNDPDNFGMAQYCVPALMYVAQDKWTAPGLRPTEFTMDQWNKAADVLTPNYKDSVSGTPVSCPVPVQ